MPVDDKDDWYSVAVLAQKSVGVIDALGAAYSQADWWLLLDTIIKELEVRRHGAETMLVASGHKRRTGWEPPPCRS